MCEYCFTYLKFLEPFIFYSVFIFLHSNMYTPKPMSQIHVFIFTCKNNDRFLRHLMGRWEDRCVQVLLR